ncbi:MAG: HPr family phosphocarrier protein [Clostridia bacterium]|nr:HPr family phosphocarrier protein [Clostridia bacterium]MBQ9922691.1 HPr family phosphocarrier protein [Clostridia bacterium]
MKSFSYTIKDEVGIHARPAGMLVNKAKETGSRVTLKKGDKSADAAKLFSIMSLGVKCGDTVEVSVDGGDEETALQTMKEFFEANL